jgi:hypothetical protein
MAGLSAELQIVVKGGEAITGFTATNPNGLEPQPPKRSGTGAKQRADFLANQKAIPVREGRRTVEL